MNCSLQSIVWECSATCFVSCTDRTSWWLNAIVLLLLQDIKRIPGKMMEVVDIGCMCLDADCTKSECSSGAIMPPPATSPSPLSKPPQRESTTLSPVTSSASPSLTHGQSDDLDNNICTCSFSNEATKDNYAILSVSSELHLSYNIYYKTFGSARYCICMG